MVEAHTLRRHGSGGAASGSRYPDDRERVGRARQAADALFAPKPPRSTPSNSLPVLGSGPSLDPQHPEEIAKAVAMPEGTAAPPIGTPPPSARSTILASQFTQIRVWVKYGMTIPQVAEVCGVPVSEIERILCKAGRG